MKNITNEKKPGFIAMRGAWFGVWFFACLAIQGCATLDINLAKRTVASGNADGAIAILRPIAAQGNRVAQYELADIYLRVQSGKMNLEEGMPWMLKAAEQGYLEAQLDLGYHYEVDYKNYTDALKWFTKAAEHLDKPTGRTAAENIGIMYLGGRGVEPDSAEAARWYRKSAAHGGARGQFALGQLYFDGQGVPKDFNQAVTLMGQAAKQQHAVARYTLIFIYAEGIQTEPNAIEAAYWYSGMRVPDEGQADYLVAKFYTEGFIARDEEMQTLSWLMRRRGVAEEPANKYLKQIYRQRWADMERAIHWYQAGAEAGFVGAQVNLARIYWDDKGSYWNCGEAIKWLKLAAEKADPSALVNMGFLYTQGPDRTITGIGIRLHETGNGLQINKVKNDSPAEHAGLLVGDILVGINTDDALKLGVQGVIDQIRASKDKQVMLSIRREGDEKIKTINITPQEIIIKCPGAEDVGLVSDNAEAVKWFQKAADRGSSVGLFFLAKAYQEGKGVAQNYQKAMDLYNQGARRGDWEAVQEISHMYNTGQGVDKSKTLGDNWMRKAIDLKHQAVTHDQHF